MKEYSIFLFAYHLMVGGACLLMTDSIDSPEQLVPSFLVLACLLGGRLLVELNMRTKWPVVFLDAAIVIAALVFHEAMFPFAGVLLIHMADQAIYHRYTIVFGGTAVLILGLILWPPLSAVLITVLCVVPLFFLKDMLRRLRYSYDQMQNRSEEIDMLREQLASQRRMIQTMEHAARLSERNRMAVRIHDKLGHGVSGSILLLEGAMLSMDKNAGKAKAAVETATENLRSAVDDIRGALREERTNRNDTSLAEIAAMLSRFEAEHPLIQTELVTEGTLFELSPLVWVCISENLSEALTNLLKHSNATYFAVSISVQNKLVRVTFKDNGIAGKFSPGMGLGAMEERCAMCHGRCFFQSGSNGFMIVMTFTRIKEE